jgi:hypothetical protein
MEMLLILLMTMSGFFVQSQAQEKPREQEPPPGPLEFRESGKEPPRPEFAGTDAFSLRVLAVRTRFHLETREYDAGMLSGMMDMAEVGGIDRTSFGLEGTLDAGPVRVILSALHEKHKGVLGLDATFEQHTFQPGSEVRAIAFFGSAEVYGRFDVAGGPAESLQLTLMAGLDFSKFYVAMKDDLREAREGFSALWPVPAIGLDARFWLSDRLCFQAGIRGTHIRYVNSIHLDGGSVQEVRFSSLRLEAGFQWDVSEVISLEFGFRGIDAFIEVASMEDTDSLQVEAGGGYAGIAVKF